MRPTLALAGATVLGGLTLVLPHVAGGQVAPDAPTAGIVVSCVQPTGAHQFDVTITNHLGEAITLENDAVMSANGGPPTIVDLPAGVDTPLADGASLALEPLVLTGFTSGNVLFVEHYTFGDAQNGEITGTADFEACEAAGPTTSTTATTAPTTSTSTPAVQAAVDFTG